MASDYGLNFGFRRSDESMATREGRFRTPKTGSPILQGAAVMIDAANPGYLKVCPSATPAQTGMVGLLVQEEAHLGSIFTAAPFQGHDSLDLGTTKLDSPSVMWAGVGTKVWFKNTGAYARAGRSKGAVTICDLTGVVVGDKLGWDGTKWVKNNTAGQGWMTVTNVNVGAGYCEAVVGF